MCVTATVEVLFQNRQTLSLEGGEKERNRECSGLLYSCRCISSGGSALIAFPVRIQTLVLHSAHASKKTKKKKNDESEKLKTDGL